MIVLLPPSETKRDGGEPGSGLELSALSFASLAPQRRKALAALRAVSRNRSKAALALGLGVSQGFEIERNRALGSSPLLPAIERYTGVLYDALDVESLDSTAREFLDRTVAIHSALFGLIGAGDPIPAYRLSHDSRLPELRLKALWREPIRSALEATEGLVLDLRSEAYVELGPAPNSERSLYLRVVSRGPTGASRALNHFNKKGKGEFVRALASSAPRIESTAELIDWAAGAGLRLVSAKSGEVELEV